MKKVHAMTDWLGEANVNPDAASELGPSEICPVPTYIVSINAISH